MKMYCYFFYYLATQLYSMKMNEGGVYFMHN
jgi:hypothetical protein